MTFICPDSLNMCSLSSYKQRERRECGYSRRFYRLNVYTTNLYPPTGNLDQKNSKEIMDMLGLSNRSLNQTILLITHDEKVALEAERIITVQDGRIVSDERREVKTLSAEL